MASTQIADLAGRYGVEVHYKPVLLGGLFQHHNSASISKTWVPAKQILGLKDIYRSAQRLGVPMEMNAGHPRRSVKAMRLILATPKDKQTSMMASLFRIPCRTTRHHRFERSGSARRGPQCQCDASKIRPSNKNSKSNRCSRRTRRVRRPHIRHHRRAVVGRGPNSLCRKLARRHTRHAERQCGENQRASDPCD